MDSQGLPEAEVAEAYQVLRRVNRQFFGSLRTIDRELRRFLIEDDPGDADISVLDIGSGSGDIGRAIQDRLVSWRLGGTIVALDRDATAIALASRMSLAAIRGDALRLPFADRSVDLITAVKFAHHFHGDALALLIAEMARVARNRVVILDIRRHWLAYWGFLAWSRVFTRNRLVRFDGPLSVLRGFTREELLAEVHASTGFDWVVRAYPGFQLALVGRRVGPRR